MTSSTKRCRHAPGSDGRVGSQDLFSTVSRLESDDVKSYKRRRSATASALRKAKAARSQTNANSKLVEMRILLQRSLQNASTLHALLEKSQNGHGEDQIEDKDDGSSSSSSKNAAVDERTDYISVLEELRDDILMARGQMMPALASYSPSDKGNISSTGDSNSGENEGQVPLESRLQSEYKKCRETWRHVLDKRHHDLRLRSGALTMKLSKKFQVVDQGIWDQIEATLAHERLLAHSKDSTPHATDGDDDAPANEMEKDTDLGGAAQPKLLYDDAKVYQHMLRDFIASGSSSKDGNNDRLKAIQARLQKSSKRKNDVDRKASKGRKLRYTVHPKLANYTFPVARPTPAIEDDDWFKSLFGGAAGASQRM